MRFLFIALLLLGCGGGEYVYWQSDFKPVKKVSKKISIDVTLPSYMLGGNFVTVDGDKLTLSDKKINSTPREFFAKYSALGLSKLLGSNVVYCPLDCSGRVVEIKIVDFYYDKRKKEAVLRVYTDKIEEFKAKNYKEAYDKFLKYLAKRL
ncbi:MAG: hypothetical protein GXO62_07070 [Epsilonproteobacteria bacterium]|nr:hypothetical protein [Campylobacterota bacterium]